MKTPEKYDKDDCNFDEWWDTSHFRVDFLRKKR